MYKKFDLTSDDVHQSASELFTDVINLTFGILPNEPSKFIRGRAGEKPHMEKCTPEEDEKLLIVALPQICTKHVLSHAFEEYSLTIMGQAMSCYLFVIKLTDENGYAAFNQSTSVYQKEFHCFTWSGRELTFSSEDELKSAMAGDAPV